MNNAIYDLRHGDSSRTKDFDMKIRATIVLALSTALVASAVPCAAGPQKEITVTISESTTTVRTVTPNVIIVTGDDVDETDADHDALIEETLVDIDEPSSGSIVDDGWIQWSWQPGVGLVRG